MLVVHAARTHRQKLFARTASSEMRAIAQLFERAAHLAEDGDDGGLEVRFEQTSVKRACCCLCPARSEVLAVHFEGCIKPMEIC
jgi:hypothetical protein